MSTVGFEILSSKDQLFIDQVISLGDRNSSTLGHFPKGAFIDQIKKNHIIIGKDGNKLIGYLLFNPVPSKHFIRITHLCLEKDYRSNGIADRLLDQLIEVHGTAFSFLVLNCREDYKSAQKFWQKYGFKPKAVKRSRSIKEKYLTTWVYDLNKTDLFTFSEPSGTGVLLDLNIIIDLRDGFSSEYNVETLEADWLQNDIYYCYSPETLNEIQKDADIERRKKTYKILRKFEEVKIGDKSSFKSICQQLLGLLPKRNNNDIADRKQLATAIISNLKYFVTRDAALLNVADKIFELYSVRVFDPVQFIIEIDQLIHSSNYHPSRLAGADYEIKRCNPSDVVNLTDAFLKRYKSENKSEFQKILSGALSMPKKAETKVVLNSEKILQAIYSWKKANNVMLIEIIRTIKSSLAITLFKQLITYLINRARSENFNTIILNESLLDDDEVNILKEFYFINENDRWIKIIPIGTSSGIELLNDLKPFDSFKFVNKITKNIEVVLKNTKSLLDLERLLFPLKIKNDSIDSYIIPIKPFWSARLFDSISAQEKLFSSDPEISWNRENVYYRSATFRDSIKNPARILWYVSDDKISSRRKIIIGTSYLDFVGVDEAKILYKKYKNLGTYEWKHVYKLASNNAHKDIMALKFSDTELFTHPVSFDKAKLILKNEFGKTYTFQSPVKINESLFHKFYEIGFNL